MTELHEPKQVEVKQPRVDEVGLAEGERRLAQTTARLPLFPTRRDVRPIWTRLLFHPSGKPRRLLRRLLFHAGGRPRGIFRRVVLHTNGRPRGLFRSWMWNVEHQSVPQVSQSVEERSSKGSLNLQHLVPEFLNAIDTVPALAHKIGSFETIQKGLDSRIKCFEDTQARIFDRIEFVRREIMFEMLHGFDSSRAHVSQGRARILNSDKVAQFRDEGMIRLNLGCGHIALDGYINVDMRELPNVDVAATVDDLPFEKGSVDEIFSAHLVEHFPQEELRRKLLPYWYACLKPGGRFGAITPDAAAMIAAAGAGTYGFEDFREVLFGAQDYEGDYHFNLLTPDSMTELLKKVGFIDVEVPIAGRRNGKCFEFEIVATKPVN